MKEEYKLSHLKELEAESIHIIREVAAEFENPVMLYVYSGRSISPNSTLKVGRLVMGSNPNFPLMDLIV